MLKKFKIGSVKIGPKEKTFIIAEIGVNHNGSYRLAEKLIKEAKKAGADCVKFQTFTADTLTRKDAKKAPYQIKNTKNKDNQYNMLKKLELKKEFYPKLIKICKKLNIIFLSTPYNFEDVDFLQNVGVQGYKFSSMHLTELKFIDYVSKKRKPVIISTGMSKMTEISKALKILKKNKNKNYVVLQCTTNYPSSTQDSNILCLNSFKKNFKCLVGFSDHTIGMEALIMAKSIGCRVYEKHFTINKMLSFDSVKLRLDREQSLSYMEFNYMILQAYDFLELNKNKNCVMQIGGSDQWGNIVNGVELIKKYLGKQSFGLTTPLITLASGTKMGKTEKGAVWLDRNMLSPYEYWQFWRNTDDRDVLNFLKMFTDINIKKIDEIKNTNVNELKIILANEATAMLHGKEAAKKAEQTAKKTFVSGSIGDDLPTIKINKKEIKNGINIVDLVVLSNLILSKSEVRRMMKNRGIKINNEFVEDQNLQISLNHFEKGNFLKLSLGKKKHVIIKMN